MTRSNFLLAVLGTALLSACGPTQVVVTAEIGPNDPSQGTESRALGDLEIRMFPYDRDLVFDSLTVAATDPGTSHPGLGTRCTESGGHSTAGLARHRGPVERPSGHASDLD